MLLLLQEFLVSKFGYVRINTDFEEIMLLQPRQYNFKKFKKGKLNKYKFRTNDLKFGTIGLKAVESGVITAKQIEAARQAITRKVRRKGKVWVRIFPNYSVTKKPTEVRMGKGKGNIAYWAAKVRGGSILFEICLLWTGSVVCCQNSK